MKQLTYMLLSVLFLYSCVQDDSTGIIHEVSDITIQDETEELNVDFGFELVRKVAVTQTQSDMVLAYEWSAAPYLSETTFDTLKVISQEEELHHVFKQRGKHHLRLKVSNEHEAVFKDYTVWVNAAFEEGVMLLAVDADNNGNLGFLKTLTPEEVEAGEKEVILEHCFTIVNPGVDMKNPLGFCKTALEWGSTNAKFILAMKDKVYFADPQTLELVGTTPIDGEFAGQQAKRFVGTDYFGWTPLLLTEENGFIHIDKKFQFLFKNPTAIWQRKYDEMLTYSDFTVGETGVGMTPYFIDYSTSLVVATEANMGQCTSLDLFKDEDIVTVFQRNGGYGSNGVYAITSPKGDADQLIIRQLSAQYNMEEWYAYFTETAGGTYTYTLSADDKRLARGTQLVGCETYAMAFWYEDGDVYAWNYLNPEPRLPNKPVLHIEGKEITCLATSTHPKYRDKWLYVGAYDPAAKRGSLYIYDCAKIGKVPDLKPEKVFENQTDRILFITDKTR